MSKKYWTGLSLVSCLYSHVILADITLDGTLGASGPLNGPDYAIDAVHGKQVGTNLFHSFSQFNIYSNESATFTGPDSINHVISRVTGGDLSTIAGELSVQIPSADFWLINPAGIVVTDDASINVNGALHLSTADYLSMSDGGRFDATFPDNSILTTGSPESYGFLDANIAPVSFSNADISSDHDINIVAGDITLDNSSVTGTSGDVRITSVGLPGEVGINGELLNKNHLHAGDVILKNGSVISSVTGDIELSGGEIVIDDSSIQTNITVADKGGSILLSGESIKIKNKSEIKTEVSSDNNSEGGDITITAEKNLDIDGVGTEVSTISNGNSVAGDINIDVGKKFTLANDALVMSEASGSSDTGDMFVSVQELMIEKSAVFSNDAVNSNGKNGSLQIDADRIDIKSRGDSRVQPGIYMFSGRYGGKDMVVNANEINLIQLGLIMLDTSNAEIAQNLYINSEILNITGGGSLSTGNTVNKFQGDVLGNLFVNADVISLRGNANISVTSSNGSALSGGSTFITAESIELIGGLSIFSIPAIRSNNITEITTNDLLIKGGGRIYANNLVNIHANNTITISDVISGIYALPNDTNAADINLRAGSIFLTRGGKISSSTVSDAGDINIVADVELIIEGVQVGPFGSFSPWFRNRFEVYTIGESVPDEGTSLIIPTISEQNYLVTGNYSGIYSEAFNEGKGGDIHISSPNIRLTNAGVISSSTASEHSAGNISINSNSIVMQESSSINSFSFTGSSGNAGVIDINTEALTVKSGSFISSTTQGAGDGGDIQISSTRIDIGGKNSNTFFDSDRNSGIYSGTSASGLGADININGGILAMTDGATLNANSTGNGDAGNIKVETTDSILLNDSKITTASDSAGGGGVTLNTINLLSLVNSTVATSVAGGDGNAGNISIDPILVELENSSILAQAFAGNGGNITIRANIFAMDSSSIIDASSTLGIDGGVDIDTPLVITEQLDSNKTGYANNINLMQSRCSAKAAYNNGSSFVTAQQGALPAQPGSYLNAQLTDMIGFNTVASASNNNNILMASNNTNLITACN